MISSFKGSIILLVIILALALPGSQGASFSGTNNGGSISANVQASAASAAGVKYVGGDFSFYGDGNAKYSRSYSTGTTWSRAGVVIKDADHYEGSIGGGKDAKAKTTNAYVDVLAEDAEYINAYGKSGTGKYIGSGVVMTVEDGDAEVAIRTQADGQALTSKSSLDAQDVDDDGTVAPIEGSIIEIKGYYTGSPGDVPSGSSPSGDLKALVRKGSISDYHLLTSSAQGGCRAMQSAETASGDRVEFASYTRETVPDKTRFLTAGIEITKGQVDGYAGIIDDHARTMAHSASQHFTSASTLDELKATTTYTETTKNSKKNAAESAYISNGYVQEYSSGAKDSFLTKHPWVDQTAARAEGDEVEFSNNYVDDLTNVIRKGISRVNRNMISNVRVDNGKVEDFSGQSESAEWSGTEQSIGTAQGESITIHNRYSDNLASVGFGQVDVDLTDPPAPQTPTLSNYAGKAKYATTDSKTAMDVKAQGQTSQLDVTTDVTASNGEHTTDSYSANEWWKNYFLGEATSSSPWQVTIANGRQLASGETIHQAINGMPYAEGNIFLLPGTYNEYGIVNNANTANGEVGFTLWGAGSYLDGEGNSVIDAQSLGGIFNLYALTGDRTFTFKNIDFNNGNAVPLFGGALEISRPGAGLKSTISIENSNFNNNRAGECGGAIDNDGGTLNIKYCSFNGNKADYGGAIENYVGTLNTKYCSFDGNLAIHGGAITNWATLNIEGCSFDGNLANNDGGAIYIAPGTTNTITNSDFQNNAAVKGNAIYTKGTAANTFAPNNFGPGQDIVEE